MSKEKEEEGKRFDAFEELGKVIDELKEAKDALYDALRTRSKMYEYLESKYVGLLKELSILEDDMLSSYETIEQYAERLSCIIVKFSSCCRA